MHEDDFYCDDEEELELCCELAQQSGESHYHCARCNGVTGMFGHYDPEKGFTCKEGEHA